MKDRACRRAAMERRKRQVRKYLARWGFSTDARMVGKYAQVRRMCSCPMCGNPRRMFGEPTVQERRAEDIPAPDERWDTWDTAFDAWWAEHRYDDEWEPWMAESWGDWDDTERHDEPGHRIRYVDPAHS